MWHESPIEMICMLKSLFRLDEDQCARRNAQKYLKIIDPDYYEFEAHIFFDDAFDLNDYGEPVVNKFVKQLIEKIDEAARLAFFSFSLLKILYIRFQRRTSNANEIENAAKVHHSIRRSSQLYSPGKEPFNHSPER